MGRSFGEALYRRIFRPLLFQLDPEIAHRLTLALLATLPALDPHDDPPELGQELWGMSFSNPVGVAAGLDKDARAVAAWQMLGFGFAELGTVTPRPQRGNPPPRLWRIPEHQALVNRLGFPSEGMDVVARRLTALRRHRLKMRIGVNLGPNRDTATEKVPEDYAALMHTLTPLADFVVVNLSSPNTPGLRDWQAPGRLRALLSAIRAVEPAPERRRPVMVKLAPDLDSDSLDQISEAALELGIDAIVATNTTLARNELGLITPMEGGLSGQPLKLRARATVAHLYRRLGRRIPIIGVGGVASAPDAYGHIQAGASLVELYTGLIYEGPALARTIKTGLAELLRRDGCKSIGQAVGRLSGAA